MKTTAICSGTLVMALLVGPTVLAADNQPGAPVVVPPPGAKSPVPEIIPGPSNAPHGEGLPPGSVTSPWIDYSRPDCCGSLCGGPIGGEWYLRTGPSIPVSNGILHDSLDEGWMVQGGARSLFFNRATTAAWTADAGVSYTYNNSSNSNVVFDQNFLNAVQSLDPITGQIVTTIETIVRTVNIREFHRASFNVTFGRDWWVWKPAYSPGWHWRIGADMGGRWGYARLNLNDVTDAPTQITFRHNSDVFGSFSAGIHNDMEIPLRGAAVFLVGFRGEWVYNWTDIVPSSAGRDLQDVNILLNMGWRY